MITHPVWSAAALVLGLAPPALACSVVGPLPTPQTLVKNASLIVHARAEGFAESPGTVDNVLARTQGQVQFRVIEVLKGKLERDRIAFNGQINSQDDWNDRPVPYDFIRRGGRGGNCFALGHRVGAEYLLLLNNTAPRNAMLTVWSPYWTPLGPTNEQIKGKDDPWLSWVRQQIEREGHVRLR
jgi:hypothetical protein